MVDITEFKLKHRNKRSIGFFPEDRLKHLTGRLPEDVVTFLRAEGKCTFGDDFFRTTLPDMYDEMLDGWGLEEKGLNIAGCHVFLRTSLGALIYYHADSFYYLNPLTGRNSDLGPGDMFELLLNFQLSMNIILEETFNIKLHERNCGKLPLLADDEMYALIPAIPLGGSLETSKLEVVKMREQLAILSGLYGHRAS